MPEGNASQDGNTVEATSMVEKLPVQVSNGRFGDQISSEMLKELAPNGEEEYILDKINNMTEEEAIAIIQESREWKFQYFDPNASQSSTTPTTGISRPT
jgi:hypothetical protein